MKKILFMIACCLMATAQTIFAQDNYSGKVFLQHKGNITAMYGGNEIDKAIEAAVDVAPRNSPSASGSIFFNFSEDQTIYNESSA